jgi:hypothetical protein
VDADVATVLDSVGAAGIVILLIPAELVDVPLAFVA